MVYGENFSRRDEGNVQAEFWENLCRKMSQLPCLGKNFFHRGMSGGMSRRLSEVHVWIVMQDYKSTGKGKGKGKREFV